ncbi:MAG: chemotaxis protein CheX [Spirochaetales bacterium]|nr:chemotaxis protein CheX [Spirochaetales bacterium]
MTEAELKFFIDVVTDYFQQVSGVGASMGIPYVKKEEAVVLSYTGLIGISGPRKGGIYFTAGPALLSTLMGEILGVEEADEDSLLDMVGEISNTVAGNVRKSFGTEFLISVPMLIKGKPDDILFRLKPPVFVIPINWRHERAFLVVGLE